MEMSFPCSSSCTQFVFAARHPGNPAAWKEIDHTPSKHWWWEDHMRNGQDESGIRQTPPFLPFCSHRKTETIRSLVSLQHIDS